MRHLIIFLSITVLIMISTCHSNAEPGAAEIPGLKLLWSYEFSEADRTLSPRYQNADFSISKACGNEKFLVIDNSFEKRFVEGGDSDGECSLDLFEMATGKRTNIWKKKSQSDANWLDGNWSNFRLINKYIIGSSIFGDPIDIDISREKNYLFVYNLEKKTEERMYRVEIEGSNSDIILINLSVYTQNHESDLSKDYILKINASEDILFIPTSLPWLHELPCGELNLLQYVKGGYRVNARLTDENICILTSEPKVQGSVYDDPPYVHYGGGKYYFWDLSLSDYIKDENGKILTYEYRANKVLCDKNQYYKGGVGQYYENPVFDFYPDVYLKKNILYLGDKNRVSALEISSNKEKWVYRESGEDCFFKDPIFGDDFVVFQKEGHNFNYKYNHGLLVLNLHSGKLRFRKDDKLCEVKGDKIYTDEGIYDSKGRCLCSYPKSYKFMTLAGDNIVLCKKGKKYFNIISVFKRIDI